MTYPRSEHGSDRSLAIVGASVRSAAYSAARAGFHPITADLFADADLRHVATATAVSPYPDGLLDWLRTVEPAAWMYTGALENHPELVDAMGWLAPLWGNSGDVLKCIRQPWNLMDALRGDGLDFPETRSDARGLAQDGSWLAKTYRGASGSGVHEFVELTPTESSEADATENATAEPGESSSPYEVSPVYQRRIDGMPCAAVFVGANGKGELLGITRQLVGEPWLRSGPFQYSGSIGPLPVDDTTRTVIQHIGDVLAERFELLGLFGVDFVLDGKRVWTIEVNPRYTASVEIVERATGVSAIAAHVAACVEGMTATSIAPPIQRSGEIVHGKAILFAKQDVTISNGFADWSLERSLRSPWALIADVSPAGTIVDAGRPVVTLFAEANSADAVESRLRQRVVEIERRLYADQRTVNGGG